MLTIHKLLQTLLITPAVVPEHLPMSRCSTRTVPAPRSQRTRLRRKHWDNCLKLGQGTLEGAPNAGKPQGLLWTGRNYRNPRICPNRLLQQSRMIPDRHPQSPARFHFQRPLSQEPLHLLTHMIPQLRLHDHPMVVVHQRICWHHLHCPGTKAHKPQELMHQEYQKQNATNSNNHYQPQMAIGPADSSAAAVIVAGGDPLLDVHQRMGIPLNLDGALQRSRKRSIWYP